MVRHKALGIRALAVALVASQFALAGIIPFKKKKYENPINKETQQPDKVLFDRAINDIEHGRYEVARITLNTLINTYDQSEFLAKAKLAIADSWYREGGAHGLSQAEAEYKDFILFYPTMPEASEAQNRVCLIHYKQMDKPDRDSQQSLRAEDECRQLIVQFPNSKYVPEAQQRLRNIQESLAEGEMRVGVFYHAKGSNPAAANRLARVVDQYPLYSRADESLWLLGDCYSKMGARYRQQSGDAYARIVREYPLSSYADEAKKRLSALEMPIPQADPVAYARMKYELEHRTHESLISRSMYVIKRGPDVHNAAKSGTPAMTTLGPTLPLSVPTPAERAASLTNDVSVSTLSNGSSDLNTKPDARLNQPGARESDPGAAQAGSPKLRTFSEVPNNHTMSAKDQKRLAKKQQKAAQKKKKPAANQNAAQPAATASATSQATVPPQPAAASSNQ